MSDRTPAAQDDRKEWQEMATIVSKRTAEIYKAAAEKSRETEKSLQTLRKLRGFDKLPKAASSKTKVKPR